MPRTSSLISPFVLLLCISLFACNTPQQSSTIRPLVDSQLPENPKGYVTDAAQVLSPTDITMLEDRCKQINDRHLAQIGILLVNSVSGEPIERASIRIARKWGIGHKGVNDGIFIMLAIQDRQSRLEVGRGLEKKVTNDEAATILDAMRPDLRSTHYAAALSLALDKLTDLLAKP